MRIVSAIATAYVYPPERTRDYLAVIGIGSLDDSDEFKDIGRLSKDALRG